MAKQDNSSKILDSAEKMARKAGYNGFSFRDIADAVGVKSSSVHYHFPSKEVLGESVIHRYTVRFLEALGHPDEFASTEVALEKYISLFKQALFEDGLMCLCGIMGAELQNLPEPMKQKTKVFFEENIQWLQHILLKSDKVTSEEQSYQIAIKIVATLEGAMIVSQTLNDDACFNAAIAGLSTLEFV